MKKALVPEHRIVAWSFRRPRQQLRDVPLQAVVGRNADGALHAALLQHLVDLGPGEGGIGPEHDFLAQFLLPRDLFAPQPRHV